MGRRKTTWEESPGKYIWEELKLLAGDDGKTPINRAAFWETFIEPKYHLSYSGFQYWWTQLQLGPNPRLIVDERRGTLKLRGVRMDVQDNLPDE